MKKASKAKIYRDYFNDPQTLDLKYFEELN